MSPGATYNLLPSPPQKEKKYFNILLPLNLVLMLPSGAIAPPSPPLNIGLYNLQNTISLTWIINQCFDFSVFIVLFSLY